MHVHVREFPVSEIPGIGGDDAALLAWLYARWQEKDELMAKFRATGWEKKKRENRFFILIDVGTFGAPVKAVLPHAEISSQLRMWKATVLVVTALLIKLVVF